jgi:superfamily II DNA or RNA helicase
METIEVELKDYSMIRLNCESHIAQEISEYFAFFVPGYKFMPAFKRRIWDGKIRLFNKMNGEINAGLYWQVKKFAHSKGYKIKLVDGNYGLPNDANKINHMEMMQWIATLNLPFLPRDYQYEAIQRAIETKRTVLISPTGSGKSLIIYLLMRWYLQNFDKSVLVIVPTIGLVTQMFSDFADYKYDAESNCHIIYSGKDKDTSKRVIISTWQSIHKLHAKWFDQFGCIFGDECHGFKSQSLSSIMNKCLNAEYRFGTTGTLDGSQTHKLVLEGLFGPIYKVTTTAELQEKKTLAKLDIDIIVLLHPELVRKEFQGKTYQDEIEYLVTNENRNKFITNLSINQKGNTLVLFNLVDRHGKVLRDMMEAKLKEGQRLFYVSGETSGSDREAVRNIVEKQKNSIILASLGTFSTGINIRNIHNIIFASPSKSQIRVLQSIGRGLRVSDDGRDTKLYDIADDIHWKGFKNYTLLHSVERVKIYQNEKFPFKITEIAI